MTCYQQSRSSAVETTCEQCHKVFSLPAGEAAKKARKYAHTFCSRECAVEFRKQPKDRGECAHCGAALTNKDQKVYCGRTCYDAHRRGSNTSATGHDKAYNGAYLRLKPQVLVRDGQTCAMTGGKRALEVHHIDHNPENNRLGNLITLSRAAHEQYHAMPDAQRSYWQRMFSELATSRTLS
ncbi:MAG: HNH endonuclease [Polaromonas sp.]|nr:HNH endonuclease [Polaromonas sp.]